MRCRCQMSLTFEQRQGALEGRDSHGTHMAQLPRVELPYAKTVSTSHHDSNILQGATPVSPNLPLLQTLAVTIQASRIGCTSARSAPALRRSSQFPRNHEPRGLPNVVAISRSPDNPSLLQCSGALCHKH